MSDVPAEQPASPAKYVPTKNWADDDEDEFESATKLSEEERKALLEKAEASKEEGTLDPGTLNEQEEGGDDEDPSSSSSSSAEPAAAAASGPAAAAASAQTNFLKQKGSAPIDTRVTFEQLLGNRQDLLSVLGELKFTSPSKIQAATISRIVNGESFKAESPSGTGKTAAFGLGAILSVDVTLKTPQVIIVSPARELAIQTHINVAALGKNVEGLEIKLCVATDRDAGAKGSKLKAPRAVEKALTAQIVIGTPGTLKNKKWDSKYAKVLVLDEADFLLEDQYNIKDIISIKKKMKRDAQVLGYSATFTDAIKEAFKEVCPVKHKYIFWKRDPSDLTLIKQYKVLVNDENIKVEILKDILTASSAAGQNIIFCQTKSTCHTVIQKLKSERYDADELTSDSTFEERDRTITHFIKGELNSLVSTNVLARGIDIQNVNLVINFDVPVTFNNKRTPVGDKTTYIHRIGRTGRWDRTGIAINIVSKTDAVLLNQIERALNSEIEEIPFGNLLDTLDAIFVAADC